MDEADAHRAVRQPEALHDLDRVVVARPDGDVLRGQLVVDLEGRTPGDVQGEGRRAAVRGRDAVERHPVGKPGEEALGEVALVRRGSRPSRVSSTYSTAATSPAKSSCCCVPVSKRAASGSSGAGRTLYGRSSSSSSARTKKRPEVRPEELVRRAEQDVRARGRDVDRPVRRVVDGVDPGERARLVRERGDPGHVADRPDGVRGPGERDDAGLVRELPLQVVEVERAVLADVHEADGEAAVLRHRQPGRDVGVVVEPRHEDLVAGAQVLARERAREAEVERRHVRPEADLLRATRRGSAPRSPCAWSTSASVATLAANAPPVFAFDSSR